MVRSFGLMAGFKQVNSPSCLPWGLGVSRGPALDILLHISNNETGFEYGIQSFSII